MEGDESSRFCNAIHVLVVDDDTTCLSSMAGILRRLKYEVVTVKNPIHALCVLRVKAGSFDLVVSDVHMPQMNGFELLKQISREFKLPVVLMSGDDKDAIAIRGIEGGAAYFMMKPIAADELKSLWQFASLSNPKKNKNRSKSRRKMSQNELGSINNLTMKKNKIVWTQELHKLFLQAVNFIGFERAVPKGIHEMMNVPGLTRINIASHLQKYRHFLKRVKEQFERANIQSPIERSLTDRRLLRSSFAFCNTNIPILDNSNCETSTRLRQPLAQGSTPNYDFGNTFLGSSSSGLMNCRGQNDYITPNIGTSNIAANYNTYGSLNNIGDGENNGSFDINGFAKHVSDNADLNTIFLHHANNHETSNQEQLSEQFPDIGALMIACNLEQNPMIMSENPGDEQVCMD